MTLAALRFQGIVYRGHDPRWALHPESGDGAALHGGRFNPPGMPALYTALTAAGAWAEAQQGFPARAQPLTLCAYEVDCAHILDLTDERQLSAAAITSADLSAAWQQLAWIERKTPPGWTLAQRLIQTGIAGIIVPSYATYAPKEARNLVLWRWSQQPPHYVRVIDDLGRLQP